jgi:pimeloyl-ACP methyl ester carboxylesterase
MAHTLYLIPGVATDRRIFAALELQHPVVVLEWTTPLHAKESMQDYARRLAAQIDPDSNPVLVGYSFGGMMAIEIAKWVHVEAIILISSIKHYQERPVAMMLGSSIRLHRIVRAEFGRNFRFAYAWLNDPANADEEAFIDTMAAEMNPRHTDWAIANALAWRHKGNAPVERLYHIHGDSDRIFPIRYIGRCIRIQGGSHLMLLNKGPEISAHIHRIIASLPAPAPARRLA